MKKHIACIIIVAIVACAAFYGGMQYQRAQSKSIAVNGQNRQFGAGQFGPGQNGLRGTRIANANFASGKILSKDATSITVQLSDGGSKIVFIATSTPVLKFAQGSSSDLTVGETITANGKANSDGSITAESIQVRPAGVTFPGMQQRQGQQAPQQGGQPIPVQ